MTPPATFADLAKVFENLVGAILSFAGIVLFILIVASGFKYITSGGDPKAVEGAKKTLTYSIAGLVILLLSYLILILIEEITGVEVRIFKISI